MDKLSQLKYLIRKVAGDELELPFVAEVVSVEEDHCTISVTSSDLEISDVKLKATIGVEDGILFTPKVGSDVLVMSIDGTLDNLSVIKVNEVDKISIVKGALSAEIDIENSKFNISQESNLFDMNFASGAFKMENKTGGVFEVGSDGKFSIKNGSDSLFKVLSDLINLLGTLKIDVSSIGMAGGAISATDALKVPLISASLAKFMK